MTGLWKQGSSMAQDIFSLSRRGDNEGLRNVLGPPSDDWSIRTISLDPVGHKNPAKLRGAPLQERVRWSGVTALHRAAANGHLETCKMLVDQYGVKVDACSTWGWYTPLHLAAKAGHERVCDFLISRGARWDCRDKQGRRCFDYAVEGHHTIMAWTMQRAMDAYEQQQYKLLTTMTLRTTQTHTQGLPQDATPHRRSFRSSVTSPPGDGPPLNLNFNFNLTSSTTMTPAGLGISMRETQEQDGSSSCPNSTPARLSISMRGAAETPCAAAPVPLSSGGLDPKPMKKQEPVIEKQEMKGVRSRQGGASPDSSVNQEEQEQQQQDGGAMKDTSTARGPGSRVGGAKGLPSLASTAPSPSPSTPTTRKGRLDMASVALAQTSSPSSSSARLITSSPTSSSSARLISGGGTAPLSPSTTRQPSPKRSARKGDRLASTLPPTALPNASGSGEAANVSPSPPPSPPPSASGKSSSSPNNDDPGPTGMNPSTGMNQSTDRSQSRRQLNTTLGSPKGKGNRRLSGSPKNGGPRGGGKEERAGSGGTQGGPRAIETEDGDAEKRGAEGPGEKRGGVEGRDAPLHAKRDEEGGQQEQSGEAGESKAEEGQEREDRGKMASDATGAWEGDAEGRSRGRNGIEEGEGAMSCAVTEEPDGGDLRGEIERRGGD